MLFDRFLDRTGRFVARLLRSESAGYAPWTPPDPERLGRLLQPGDVLLVEGNQRVSAAIKYLTQSTWSHSALYVGDVLPEPEAGERPVLVEVNVGEGCIAVPLSKYVHFNTRICRPIGLTPEDRATVVRFMIERIGLQYDMRNLVDLLRYFFPFPPVPVRWRRRMISVGSGDPTRAICSTLIAQAFQEVRYPILPRVEAVREGESRVDSGYSTREILHIRHHSLYTPRDFDVSPYFEIIKPTIALGFDYKTLEWHEPIAGHGTDQSTPAAGRPETIEGE
jgi:hypothetical protein